MTEFIPGKRADDYKDLSARADDPPRFNFPPHFIMDGDQRRYVLPAQGCVFTVAHEIGTGIMIPMIRVDVVPTGVSLQVPLTVNELRVFAADFVKVADQMDQDAANLLAATLAKGK